MRAVVDANILLSALLKDSITRKPLLDPRHSFLAPEHLLVEFSRHLQTDRECAKKIKVGKEQAQQVAGSLLAALTAVPEKEYAAFLPQALRLAVPTVAASVPSPLSTTSASSTCPCPRSSTSWKGW